MFTQNDIYRILTPLRNKINEELDSQNRQYNESTFEVEQYSNKHESVQIIESKLNEMLQLLNQLKNE